jgi:hypothetical protein
MADLEFKDVTGEPRSDAELREALETVERHLVRSVDKLMQVPDLFMALTTVRDALHELLAIRVLIRRNRENRS